MSPEEQEVTKGGPENRRQFFDKTFSVVSRRYLDVLQKYGRTLKQRNSAILRSKEDSSAAIEIDSWNEQLAQNGTALWGFRSEHMKEFIGSLNLLLSKYEGLAEIEIYYRGKTAMTNDYVGELQRSKNKDLKLGRTTFGPHRDDIMVLWGGNNVRIGGSQGEHKLCLVFLKLAEMVYIKNKTGSTPTLLLDDLFAKLDLERSKSLVKLFHALDTEWSDGVQTIITTTDMVNVEKSGMILTGKEELELLFKPMAIPDNKKVLPNTFDLFPL